MSWKTFPLVLIVIQFSFGNKIPNAIQNDIESFGEDAPVAESIYKAIEFSSYFIDKMMGEEEELVVEDSEKEGRNVTQYIKITSSIEIPETESLKLVMQAVRVLWNAIMTGVRKGFLPTLERTRRSADSSRGFILDWSIDLIGALIGRQECSQRVACRTGRLAQEKIPGSQMLVVMMESFVPPAFVHWFSILKTGVMSTFDACDGSFLCDFTDI